MILNQILDKIKEYQNITIFRHVRPDGDLTQIGFKAYHLSSSDGYVWGTNIFGNSRSMDTEVSDDYSSRLFQSQWIWYKLKESIKSIIIKLMIAILNGLITSFYYNRDCRLCGN